MNLRKGQRVTVSRDGADAPGVVLDIRDAADPQPVPELPTIAAIAVCLHHHLHIRRVLYTVHRTGNQAVCYAALEDAAGAWRNIHGQRLIITTKEQQPCESPNHQPRRSQSA